MAVILHYIGLEDTVQCIESFLTNCDDIRIVVVDNASPNGSGKELFEAYEGNCRVTVLLNKENLGFSAGNNVGIAYALNNFDFSFLVLANNDTIVLDDRLIGLIQHAYDEYGFAVLGPMILTADGRCDSNPLYHLPYTREKAINDMKYHRERIHSLEHPAYGIIRSSIRRVRSKFNHDGSDRFNRGKSCGLELITQHENVVLHGSFLVFSTDYFGEFKGLDARTFLYAEEDILYQHCVHHGLSMLYYPQIIVYHKEDGSLKRERVSERERDLFWHRHAIDAIEAYISLLDEYEGKSNS